jgi:hypothetical protein
MNPDDLISQSQDLIKQSKNLFKPSNKQHIQDQKDHALNIVQSDSKPLETKFRPSTFTQFQAGNLFGQKTLDKNDIVAFIERFYLTHKTLPNRPDFENPRSHLPKTLLPKTHEGWQDLLLEIEPALRARGIPHYDTPADFLEPNFILAVNLITNPYDKRPVASKLKDANLTTKQWKNLLLKPTYLEFYQSNLDKIFDEQTKLDAKLGIQRLIASGDLNAIKHYQELQNIYRPQANYNDLLMKVIGAVIEVLAVHVSTEVLHKVASEITQVINTNAPIDSNSHSLPPVGLPLGA